jgi:D-alanine-D-alanine ligase
MSLLFQKRIAVLKGGPGSERPVSLASAAGVAGALRELGAEVTEVDVTGAALSREALPASVDLAFNVIHGTYGEDGRLQHDLDTLGIPYTGEGAEGSEIAFDKLLSKARFFAAGVPTAAYEVIPAGATPTLPLPYVIKAPREGSSVGVYIVRTEAEIAPAVAAAAQYAEQLLVEVFVSGRELTVGILGDLALPIVEIRPREGFYDFNNKYPFLCQGKGAADHFCPAALDEATTRRVQETALAAQRALGLEVYSRVDVLLTPQGDPVVLEINTIPGMTQTSLLPEAAGVAGIGYAALCERIASLSLQRFTPQP